MPRVMTTLATVTCPHGGVGTSIPSLPIWSIEGGFALREGDQGVLSCPFLPPCVGYTLRSMGLNATMLDGSPVILETDFNQTHTGLPLLIVEHNHAVDNSVPSPVPIGGEAPPLSPELLDTTPPTVVPAPPVGVFNLVTQLPVMLPITFTLSSAFPLQWILTRVSEPPLATNSDLTNGDPTGAVVVPAGGAWDSPSLVVTLTLSAAYLTALGAGIHHFYMTAVNQRGLSSWQQAVVTVS